MVISCISREPFWTGIAYIMEPMIQFKSFKDTLILVWKVDISLAYSKTVNDYIFLLGLWSGGDHQADDIRWGLKSDRQIFISGVRLKSPS